MFAKHTSCEIVIKVWIGVAKTDHSLHRNEHSRPGPHHGGLANEPHVSVSSPRTPCWCGVSQLYRRDCLWSGQGHKHFTRVSSTWGDTQGTEKPDSSPSPLIPASPWLWPLSLPGAQLLPELCSHHGGLDPGQWWLMGCGGGCFPDSARWCSCSELGLWPQALCGRW